MASITTPQRVLAIVGGAFVLATAHAMISGPLILGPSATKTGTDGVNGDPTRGSGSQLQPQVDPIDSDPVTESREPEPTVADPIGEDVPEGTLTLSESYELWEMGAYFFDARYEDEFVEGRIQYAGWLPATRFDSDLGGVLTMLDSVPIDGTLVIYCVGGECDASKNTAARLEQLGYTDLRIMGAAYTDWVSAGYPTESGPIGGAP